MLTTPVIRCLKQQVEGAEVHFVTKIQYASIVASNPYIDKVHFLENGLNLLIKELKKEEFDYIIDLHHNIRSTILKIKLNIISFTFRKINFQKWLMVAFKKNYLPRVHIVDRYFETLKLFDVVNDNKGLDFFVEPKNEVDIQTLPSAFHEGYVAIAIGAKHATKQMPDDKIAKICVGINLPVLLMGGSEDNGKAGNIISLSGKSKIFSACGGFNLQQSASLLKQAKLVISHDTGLMHIAAAFRKKLISIWEIQFLSLACIHICRVLKIIFLK